MNTFIDIDFNFERVTDREVYVRPASSAGSLEKHSFSF